MYLFVCFFFWGFKCQEKCLEEEQGPHYKVCWSSCLKTFLQCLNKKPSKTLRLRAEAPSKYATMCSLI